MITETYPQGSEGYDHLEEVIRKEGDVFVLYSHEGKVLMRSRSRERVERHERLVKHVFSKKESAYEDLAR